MCVCAARVRVESGPDRLGSNLLGWSHPRLPPFDGLRSILDVAGYRLVVCDDHLQTKLEPAAEVVEVGHFACSKSCREGRFCAPVSRFRAVIRVFAARIRIESDLDRRRSSLLGWSHPRLPQSGWRQSNVNVAAGDLFALAVLCSGGGTCSRRSWS